MHLQCKGIVIMDGFVPNGGSLWVGAVAARPWKECLAVYKCTWKASIIITYIVQAH